MSSFLPTENMGKNTEDVELSLHLVNLVQTAVTTHGVLAAELIGVPVCCALGFWILVACRRAPQASAWSAPSINIDSDAKDEADRSARLPGEVFITPKARLRVDLVIVQLFAIGTISSLSMRANVPLVSAVLGWLVGYGFPGFLVMILWARLGKHNSVSPSLVLSFFISGSILSVLLAFVGEVWEELGWNYTQSLYCGLPLELVTEECTWVNFASMFFAPGLLEETAKACWLFLRLRRSAVLVPSHCCCGIWRVACCLTRGLYLHAPTPYDVILAAAACGAGFQASENLTKVWEVAEHAAREGLTLDPGSAVLLHRIRARPTPVLAQCTTTLPGDSGASVGAFALWIRLLPSRSSHCPPC
mmetsp:Transcript_29793/g.63382  ORF Transcript_29793/g.63382 Transcript_29793/m.63382 type:complete len:360 (+) Transcript_29793:135-1214(+)